MTDRASAAVSKGTAANDSVIGRVIGGRFKITALIARGGMGKVYRAEQAPLGRVCAVKVLNPSYAGEHDPEFHKRFFLEASTASKLTHPNTVTIFDYGRTDDDIYFMAMEYLEGHTLHRAIREAGYLPEARAAHIARQICRALREAHALGVIHRDLKPANIFLVQHGDEADFVKVLDFGLVKLADNKGEDLTQTGMFMGSPKYMSPEQIRGDRVDPRSDIYALGIVLYEMLTGKVPFDRPNSVNILMAHVGEPAPPMLEMNPQLSASAAIEETVRRCLEKDPSRRYGSMDEVLASLKRVTGTADAPPITGLEVTERVSLSGSGSGPRLGSGPVTGASGPVRSSRTSELPSAGAPSAATEAPAPARLPVHSLPPKAGSKRVLVAAVAGALAVAAVMSYLALRSESPAPRPNAAAAAVPLAQVSAAAAALPLAAPTVETTAPARVALHVATDPDGASVKEDGTELCPSTPCDVVFQGAEAEPNREHKLTLTRPGFRAEVRAVKAGDPPIVVKLAPIPRAALPPPARVELPPAVPTGYKTDIPY